MAVQIIQADNGRDRGTIQAGNRDAGITILDRIFNGWFGVMVGVSVGTMVSVGVGVMVTVAVGLERELLSGSFPVPFKVKNRASAPTTRNMASRPSAIGRLRVTSGMRAPWIAFSDFVFCFGVALNSVPQTTHRVAFSASRVPQVGQSLVWVASGLIVRGLYHETGEMMFRLE